MSSIATSETHRDSDTEFPQIELLHVHGDLAPIPIQCRNGRRLGQHTLVWDGASIGVDVFLSRVRAASTNDRIPMGTGADPERLLTDLRKASDSPVVLRVVMGSDHEAVWLLDSDQMAGLDGSGWHLNAAGVDGRTICCGTLTSTFYSLAEPGESMHRWLDRPPREADLRTRIASFRSYGDVTNSAPHSCTKAESGDAFVTRPSKGAWSGTPGIELTQGQLEHLRESIHSPKLKFGDWVVVRHDFRSAVGPKALRLPVMLRHQEEHAEKQGGIGVDQVIRLAVGVATWETIAVEAVAKTKNLAGSGKRLRAALRKSFDTWLERLFPSVHVVARVQPAELTLTEQNACLLSPLALNSLGINSGDEIVIHAAGVDGDTGRVEHVFKPVKAYTATDDVVARRMQIYGGGRGAPLPSEEQALQFPQALPWIWIDAALRRELGLGPKLNAVVVAPNRRYALMDNLREVAIITAVAFGGAAASSRGIPALILAGVALVLPVILIGSRLRSKLR